MKKRMFVVVLAAFVFIAAIGAVQYGQIKQGLAQQKAFKMPPEAVTNVVVKDASWSGSIESIGTVAAVHGVTVSADLPGIVSKILFESGQSVKEGQVLVLLDTKQEQAQLASAEAQVAWTKVSLDRQTGLRKKGISAQADWDRADADQKQAVAKKIQIEQAQLEQQQELAEQQRGRAEQQLTMHAMFEDWHLEAQVDNTPESARSGRRMFELHLLPRRAPSRCSTQSRSTSVRQSRH